MDRRTFLLTAMSGTAVGTAGCVAGGRVVHEKNESIDIEPHRGWTVEITDVEGDGAVSYTVRAERRFDVYYFTSPSDYDHYASFLAGNEPEETPTGHDELSQAAVQNEQRDLFEATTPEDGGRKSITVEDRHYFVVDHSNYGMGVPVEEFDEPLDAFVDLTVYNNTFPI